MRTIEEIVEGMREHAKDGPVLIKELSEQGVPIVGTYCTFVPWEIIHAAGAVRLRCVRAARSPLPPPRSACRATFAR